MTNEIPDIAVDMPTYEQIVEVLRQLGLVDTNVTGVKTDVATVKNSVASVNTNVSTINTNLGAPGTPASNSTSANAQAKINWLLTNLNTVLTTLNSMKSTALTKPVLKKSGVNVNSGAGIPSQVGTLAGTTLTASSTYLNVSGSGRLLGFALNKDVMGTNLIIIDGVTYSVHFDGVFNIPFSTSLRVDYGASAIPSLILYELNM